MFEEQVGSKTKSMLNFFLTERTFFTWNLFF